MAQETPYNRPYLTGRELDYIRDSHNRGQLAGDGYHTKACEQILQKATGAHRVLLTHSCTAALEMAAILFNISEGDEVILPSYTFVSTANAFVLRGATPVFVDIRPDTLNINENQIEKAITNKTRAIAPIHYAGIGCEMEKITEIADRYGLRVVEDAAQGVQAKYRNQPLGTLGHLGAFSFHETKNIISGEGGALLVNDPILAERAEYLREKGTNRANFFRGNVDKYTWVDIGSSYIPGEIIAAFLHAQLEEAAEITRLRMQLWEEYHHLLEPLEQSGRLRRPFIPDHCKHNAHLYHVILETAEIRDHLIKHLRNKGIQTIFHYIPLHSSPAGRKYGRCHGELPHTDDLSARLLRLPLWIGLESPAKIVQLLKEAL
jgi:dTDP-4-amino-4,6-dideoxygalactose transaminase